MMSLLTPETEAQRLPDVPHALGLRHAHPDTQGWNEVASLLIADDPALCPAEALELAYAELTAPMVPVVPSYTKEIVYDSETRDFAMLLDNGLIGFARTYREAELTLDQLIFELTSGQHFRQAS